MNCLRISDEEIIDRVKELIAQTKSLDFFVAGLACGKDRYIQVRNAYLELIGHPRPTRGAKKGKPTEKKEFRHIVKPALVNIDPPRHSRIVPPLKGTTEAAVLEYRAAMRHLGIGRTR